jgi:transcriptional regulator with XRE-family HTH domain
MTLPQTGEVPAWTLPDRLRKARTHANLSQQELAVQLGISRYTVVNYESGRIQPGRSMLLAWAMICDVDAGWLTGPPSDRGGPVRRGGRPLRGLVAYAGAMTIAFATMAALTPAGY